MARTRQPALTAILTAAARDIHRATRTANPTQTSSLDQLREHGWQLAHLTGGLAELAALLAEHTGHHTTRPDRLYALNHTTDSVADAGTHLARACRALTDLRQALEHADTAARDYYTALSHLITRPGAGEQP